MLNGYLAPALRQRNALGILLIPTWLNVEPATCAYAERLAGEGFTTLVADLFGNGRSPKPPEIPTEAIAPLLADRSFFRRRLLANLAFLAASGLCSPDRIAAVGFCIGGLGALDLARSNAPLTGVASIHGLLLGDPSVDPPSVIRPRIAVLHGDADPVVPASQVAAFTHEMRGSHADWQLHIYGGATHGFSGLGSSNPADGTAANRSWRDLLAFLQELSQSTALASEE